VTTQNAGRQEPAGNRCGLLSDRCSERLLAVPHGVRRNYCTDARRKAKTSSRNANLVCCVATGAGTAGRGRLGAAAHRRPGRHDEAQRDGNNTKNPRVHKERKGVHGGKDSIPEREERISCWCLYRLVEGGEPPDRHPKGLTSYARPLLRTPLGTKITSTGTITSSEVRVQSIKHHPSRRGPPVWPLHSDSAPVPVLGSGDHLAWGEKLAKHDARESGPGELQTYGAPKKGGSLHSCG